MKVGIERVIDVLQEEIERIDGYCDDFTKDYGAWASMEKELDKLKEVLAFVQKKPFPKAKPHGKEYRQRSPVKMANGIPDRPEAKPKGGRICRIAVLTGQHPTKKLKRRSRTHWMRLPATLRRAGRGQGALVPCGVCRNGRGEAPKSGKEGKYTKCRRPYKMRNGLPVYHH